MTAFSPQQDAALKAVAAWLRAGPGAGAPQIFRLFGYAGTGKTTLARHIAEDIDGETRFCAYTGKAALAMRAAGCPDASTIHSLIYKPRESSEETPDFVLWESAPVGEAALLIVDECSMVDEELARDLLSFGVPLLVLGDPAQLPPVSGGGFFTDAEPDIMLTEVHRQAADNPIIRLSMDVREGRGLSPGAYGDSLVVPRAAIDPARVHGADQVLVGRNATRRSFNARLREILGHEGALPVADDKLVCLRNKRSKGLFNGGLWTVGERQVTRQGFLKMRIMPEEGGRLGAVRVTVRPECFDGTLDRLDWTARRRYEEFDFRYALTVHKAQGSQWDDVVLFDESFAFAEARDRWLYTGITRAAERLMVVV
ncbi:MAG: AAA family ATPase [Alphaproteobacteria bacterium]|nr:AAA family ATPase [Alphaproteobacteria bacterium]